jgi:hypothetical protein
MSFIGIEKEINQTEDEIKSKINEEICRNKIDIKEIIKKFVKYITIFLEDEMNNMIGFLIFDINYSKSYIEIHYLCSMEKYKGNGNKLLDKIKEYATKADIYKIILTPGLDKKIIKYYTENGFKEEGWNMIYTIIKGGKTIRKQKKRRTTQKNRI